MEQAVFMLPKVQASEISQKPKLNNLPFSASASSWINENKWALLLFAVNIFLISPALFPAASDINPWDEAAYINSGRMLLDKGMWPNFANSPLVSLFYALTYLPFRHSSYWMVQACSLGRILLFSLLWLSLYLGAKQLTRYLQPLVVMGIFLVTPLAVDMLHFPSDPLFAGLAGLSFWQLLSYLNHRSTRHLWLASAFMGLAALARNDGLILFILLVILVLILSIRTSKRWIALAAVLLPFCLLVGGYDLFYGLRYGDFSLGTMQRTYENFETGHGIIY